MHSQLHSDSSGSWYLGEQLLHPSDDPLAAARRDLRKLLGGATSDDLLVLAGCGLGYHAQAAGEGAAAPKLVIYEPDDNIRRVMANNNRDINKLEIATDEQALTQALAPHLIYGQPARVAVYSPPAYVAAAPQVGQAARRIVQAAYQRRQVDQATRREKNLLWLEYITENFKYVPQLPDLTGLTGRYVDIPCLVVGAGPSLDQSLATIAKYQDRALIIAAASALGPLRSAGVSPAVAVALEARDESRQFIGADQQATILAAASASNPNHFAAWQGPKSIYHLQPWLAEMTGKSLVLPSGGHAGSAAFSFAILWGCSPIILVGQDLAYTGGRFHAGARPGGEDYQRQDTTPVEAIGGGTVETSAEWLSYLQWYREAAGYLTKIGQANRVFNATVSGARIPGFDPVDLKQILQRAARIPQINENLFAAAKGLTRPSIGGLKRRLSQVRSQVVKAVTGLGQGQGPPESAAAAWALEGLDPLAQPKQSLDTLNQLLESLGAMGGVFHD